MSSFPNPDFQVIIEDYPYNPRNPPRVDEPRLVRRRRSDTATLYYIYIRLEGPDLPLVRGVTYFLHPTVSPSQTYIDRTDSNPDCMLELWLWGTFEVRASVVDIRSRTLTLPPHYLRFDSYFQKEKFGKLGLIIRDEGAESA